MNTSCIFIQLFPKNVYTNFVLDRLKNSKLKYKGVECIMKDEILKVRVSESDKELIKNYAKRTNQSMSSFILRSAIDECFELEQTRQVEVLNDFVEILAGRFESLGKNQYSFPSDEITTIIHEIHDTVLTERLPYFYRFQKRNSRTQSMLSELHSFFNSYHGEFDEKKV